MFPDFRSPLKQENKSWYKIQMLFPYFIKLMFELDSKEKLSFFNLKAVGISIFKDCTIIFQYTANTSEVSNGVVFKWGLKKSGYICFRYSGVRYSDRDCMTYLTFAVFRSRPLFRFWLDLDHSELEIFYAKQLNLSGPWRF